MVANTSLQGLTGSPTQASAQRGRDLFHEIGEALAKIVERARTEKPPLPWRRDASFFNP
jgi:creatinine amidohydrolase